MSKKYTFKRITAFILAAVMITLSFGALIGCSLFDRDPDGEVEFSKSKIELNVGDKYDLAHITFVDYGSCTYSSSDPSVASVSGSLLTAKSVGTAVITARVRRSGNEAKLRVTVLEEDGFTLGVSGSLVQTMGATENVEFTVSATGMAAGYNVSWYVSGEYQCSLAPSIPYTFIPVAAGAFVITASSEYGDYEASETVRVYYDADASGSYDGEIYQTEAPYTPVKLTAWAEEHAFNPIDPYIEWFVDGARVYGGTATEYEYYPTAGKHTVTLKVNGKTRDIDGQSSLDIVCVGSIVPSDISVVYDNVYPHVYVRYDAVGSAAVEITSPIGNAVTVSQIDRPELFDENGFDAGEYINVCASSSSVGDYKIRVKSLGDGVALTESAYTDRYTFTQLPQNAEKYLRDLYLDRDHYITSDEEYVNLFEYYVINRTKIANAEVSFECYIGYQSDLTNEELWNSAFQIGATSGSYTGKGITKTGNVIKTNFKVSTVNSPTRQTYSRYSSEDDYSKQLHANIPHINYDEDKYRPSNHVFPIDELERTQSVTYTDELYLAAENNTRPVPTSGSAADAVYRIARDILRQIVTDDMSDAQKAHAIYDWIMWQVTYDTPATEVTKNGEAYSAYYMEGVFGDGVTPIRGVTYDPYAVCDGMSKAYSLLCNIEGIPCMRVSGMAGSYAAFAGGHAWNKVMLDGEWYIVDCTWGDSTIDLRLGYAYESYECALHDWLFVTDDYANDTHYEPYSYAYVKPSWGECKVRYAPKTASKAYDVYKDMTYNGVKIDCRLFDDGSAEDRYYEIVTQFMNAYVPRSTIRVPGYKDCVYTLDYEALEIKLESEYVLTESQFRNIATAAVLAIRPTADVEIVISETIALVLVSDL